MPVLLIFVDGLGIGRRSPSNPLYTLGEAALPLAVFADEAPKLTHGGILARTDARLGVEGRPQSASGQTTILTGVNAPALFGYHKQGFPNERMREIIRRDSVFLRLLRANLGPVAFANAYSQRFFEERPRWVSATTVAVEAADIHFRTVDDIRQGRALYHDFTNQLLIERGEDVPQHTPDEAAQVLSEIARTHRFTLYEYFLTDHAGHKQDEGFAFRILTGLAAFVRSLLESIDLNTTTVILTSDHGNVEDLLTRNHTLNFVPTLVWGPRNTRVGERVRSLADIAPTIFEILAEEANHT